LKADDSNLDDTIDQEFRKLAMKPQNLDASGIQDLNNFVVMMSEPRKSRGPLKSARGE